MKTGPQSLPGLFSRLFSHSNVKQVYILVICIYVYFRVSYPPKVFSIGLPGYIVFGVDVSLQGAKASPLRNIFFAEHSRHLERREHLPLAYGTPRLTSCLIKASIG